MMNTFPDNEMPLARFLLDELPLTERETLETRLLMDDELQTQVAAAEFDLIDDYLRGHLTVAQRTRFEQVFLNSSERHSKLATARAFWESAPMATETSPKETSNVTNLQEFAARKAARAPRNWKFPLALAASVLLLLSLTATVYRVFFFASPTDQGLALLQRAYQNERPLEARVSGFAYAPFVQRLGPAEANRNGVLREQAGSELRRAYLEKPSTAAQHALGKYYLVEGKFDEAIKQLEAALQAAPNQPQLHNDLGAALMGLAQREKHQAGQDEQKSNASLKHLGAANEHFAQALQLDAKFAAALFNQALCLQSLRLFHQAREAWQHYLQLDATSEWAVEARRYLTEVEEQQKQTSFDRERLYQNFRAAYAAQNEESVWQELSLSREQTGSVITEKLLDEYLTLLAQARPMEAKQTLDALAYVGALEARRTGDLFTNDLVGFYRACDAPRLAIVRQARQLFQTASQQNQASQKTEALQLCQQARQLFVQAGNHCEAALVDSLIGNIYKRLSAHEPWLAIAERSAQFAASKNYFWLQLRALDLRLSLYIELNEYYGVVNAAARACALVERVQDVNRSLRIFGQLSFAHWCLGDYEQALGYAGQAATIASRQSAEPKMMAEAYSVLSDSFGGLNLLFTNAACEKEALAYARASGNPVYQTRSFDYLSVTYTRLQQYDKAFLYAEESLKLGRSIPSVELQQDVFANAYLRLGHLYRETGKSGAALDAYNECFQLSEQRGIVFNRFDAHRGRLMVYLAQANWQAAQTEWEKARQLLEQNRAAIGEESLRYKYFARGQDVYDLAIALTMARQNDLTLAFDYAELGRARALLDALQPAMPRQPNAGAAKTTTQLPLSLVEIQKQLPAATQIVQYAALQDRLYIWVISNQESYGTVSPIGAAALEEKVRGYLARLDETSDRLELGQQPQTRELFELLLQPILARLDPQKELCFVPDKSLNLLPFAALIEPASGKYLVELFTISYAPSANVFLASTALAQTATGLTDERCLSLGNPAFDQRRFAALPVLTSTADEAARIARLYRRAHVLLAETATEKSLLQAAPDAEVIHLASHGLSNETRPEHSGIVLARELDADDQLADGMLQAREVRKERFPRARLVVLSACQTWLGRNYHGEGMVGLGRAFLAAGVPLVVASLWQVKSGETAELMWRFHQQRTQRKLSTTHALRAAQLAMLPHTDWRYRSPNAWAGFITLGGYARF